ncbi:MAG: hypothetical protein GEU28_12540 [Dehalococcoidia bacterium]|nr:hypothetical protein [Dehalococcoidia bacterium]
MLLNRLLLPVALLLSLALLAAACGDDDDDSDADDEETVEEEATEAEEEETETATEEEATEEEEPESTPSEETTAEEGGGASGDTAEFEEILGNLDDFRAAYQLEGAGFTGSATLYQSGGNFRMDFEGDDLTGTLIVTDTDSYICSDDVGGEGGEGFCLAFPGGEELGDTGVPFSQIFSDILAGTDEAGVSLSDAEDREVAGEEASCFNVSSTEDGLESETLVCLSSDGIPLLIEGTTEGEIYSMEATSVSDDVSDADFEPPYPVQELDLGDFDFDAESGN